MYMHSLVTSSICVRMLSYVMFISVMFLPLYIWPIWLIFPQSHIFYPAWVPFGKGCYQRHFAGGPWPSGRGLLRNSCDRHTVLQRGGLLPPQEWDPDDHWDSDEKQRWNKPWVNVGKPMGSSGKSSILMVGIPPIQMVDPIGDGRSYCFHPSSGLVSEDIFWSYPNDLPSGSKFWKLLGSTQHSNILATDVLPDPLNSLEADPAMKIYFLMCSRFCLYFCDRLSCICPTVTFIVMALPFVLQSACLLPFASCKYFIWIIALVMLGVMLHHFWPHLCRCSSVLIDVHRFSSMLSMLTTFRQFLTNRRKIMKTGGNSEIFTKICKISSKITRTWQRRDKNNANSNSRRLCLNETTKKIQPGPLPTNSGFGISKV